jgi:hypothetical protein
MSERLQPPVDDPLALRAGRALDVIGQALLPVGVGAVGGFWAADQGMKLLPDLLELVLGIGLLALVLIVVGRFLCGKTWKGTPQGVVLRRRVVGALVMGMLVVGGRLGVWYTQGEAELTRLGPAEFESAFVIDSALYREQVGGLETLLDRMEAADLPRAGDAVLTADEEALLLSIYSGIHRHAIALDQVRLFWEDWYRYDPSRVERSYHLRSFLLTYAAELGLYQAAARFSGRVLQNRNAVKFLDAPHPEQGLPEHSFSRFREELLGTSDQARVVAGEQYRSAVEMAVNARIESRAVGADWLWREIDSHLSTVEALGLIDRATLQLRADSQDLKRQVRRVWFPLQKGVAESMGDTRLRRIGWYLIDQAMAEEFNQKLEPGDILVSRKNWYLSNVGLPGFWPHGLLYVGEPASLAAWSNDPAVQAWASARCGKDCSFVEYLQQRYPSVWALYQLGPQEEGEHAEPFRVIEAVSEGVVWNTLTHAAGDYLGAVRPRLDKLAKAQAIDVAFATHGKPYDFDFDFATDNAVVCTELVYRAYRPAEGKAGLTLPLIELAGRQTLPANDLIAHYSAHAEEPDRQLDFVGFIDASERDRKAIISDEAAFRGTPARSRYDVAVQ